MQTRLATLTWAKAAAFFVDSEGTQGSTQYVVSMTGQILQMLNSRFKLYHEPPKP